MTTLTAKKQAAIETKLETKVAEYKELRRIEKAHKETIDKTTAEIVSTIELELTPQGETPPKTVVMSEDKVTITRRVLSKDWDQELLKKTLKAKLYKTLFVQRLQIDLQTEEDLQAALKALKKAGLTIASGKVIDATVRENEFSEDKVTQMVKEGLVKKSSIDKCYEDRLGKAQIRVSKAGKEKEEKKLYL